ncbi:MAG: MFS transporter [Desulfobacterota bacterium]|nr:MFS transporter [Thermodesulfobacteriota bacterium]
MDSSQRIKIFSVLSLSIFTAMLGLGIVVPILPQYAQTLGASGVWLGAIFAGFSIARSVSMPFVGRFSDRRGRKVFIVSGLFVYALSSLGYVYAYSPETLLIVRILQGLCSAMIVPIAMAYIGDISPKDREGSYLGMFNVSLFLGFGFGPFVGGFIHDLLGVNADFVVMGVLCAVSWILAMLYLPSGDTSSHALRFPPASYPTMLRNHQVQGIMLFRFMNAFIRGSVITFLPLYASYRLNLSGAQIGLVVSSGVILTSLLQYPCGRLADKFDRKHLMINGTLVYAVCVILLPLTPNFFLLLGTNLLLGALGAVPLPAASAAIIEEGKKYGMGSVMALFNIAMSLGLGTGPLVSGLIHDVFGLSRVFYCAAGIGACGALLSVRLLRSGTVATRHREAGFIEEP